MSLAAQIQLCNDLINEDSEITVSACTEIIEEVTAIEKATP